MGLNIKDIILREEIEVCDLKGKLVCVDAFNVLYQFLSSIRQLDGTPLMDDKKRITSHLSGILYRNIALLEQGLKLVYVFDGKPPELKRKIHKKRQAVRDLAEKKYENAKQEENIFEMKRYSSQILRLNDEMISESKELLEAMGIAVVQAPGEGEAEASYLSKIKPKVFGAVSQDYDCLLFGAPNLIRNLTVSRKKKTYQGYIEVKPELINLEKVLNNLGINLDQLICLGILVGTDYNPRGIPGIGQKKALEIVKQFKQPVLIFNEVEQKIHSLPEEDQFDWKEIFELFHNPFVIDKDFEFKEIDTEKMREILIEKHNFSKERVERQIERLKDIKEKSKQKNLERWF